MTGPYRALPLLANFCTEIDSAFVEEVGPFGRMLCAEVRSRWLSTGNRMKTSDLEPYIEMLASEIDDRERMIAFVARARGIVGVR
jgi:hypothetical protein